MSVTAGSRLAQYELTALIGEGGMGRVFHARDTKLGRRVAVKVLPDAFATDADRIARFEREAKVLASLNHPNIASLFGMEQADGNHFLVMELIEGDTIADRLHRGPLPIVEAVALAVQIAEALEAAHERGVVHRDLKPANVKVTPDGKVKVLDFGLAKAMDTTPGGREPSPTAANSPTLSMMATQAGLILGTAAYMSPEQARGAPADARSDIFSFGCLLYEMLTGRQAFHGETAAEILASVLIREPDFTLLPAQLDPRLRDVLRRCLEKNAKRRWQAAGDLKIELETIATGPVVTPRVAPVVTPTSLWRSATPIVLTAMVFTGVAGTLAWRLKPAATPSPAQFSVYPPEGVFFITAGRSVASGVISPDGTRLAFTARSEGANVSQLWVRPIDALTAQPLAGTDGASFPFWSPDSRFIGFFTADKLQKISASGGPPQVLCGAVVGRGGAWNREGTILFQAGTAGTDLAGLLRVSSAGGMATPATKLGPKQGDHRFPTFLPGGRRFLFYVTVENAVYAGSLDSDQATRLIQDTSSGAVFSSTGHLLFVRQGTLLAQPFDPEALQFTAEPFPIAQNVSGSFTGHLTFSISETGTLVYGVGPRTSGAQQLVWVDRQGKAVQQVGAAGQFKGIDLSPNQRQLVFHRDQGDGGDVWLLDLSRAASSRLTTDGPQQHTGPAIWSPDGNQIAYNTFRSGKWALHQRAANGLGAETLLLDSDFRVTPFSWSPDGTMIVFQRTGDKTQEDIWVLPLSGDRKPFAFQNSGAQETHPEISPDGKWIAYTSVETLNQEIYVRSFPSGPAKRIVSTGGGGFPRWRADGKELFYVRAPTSFGGGVGMLMAVEVRASISSLELGQPRELFENNYVDAGPDRGGNYQTYAVSRDGQRFLIPRAPSSIQTNTMPDPIVVILNWPATLGK